MNKHLLWVVPVGVAAGLSIPLVVPVRKAPPAPPPAVPFVTVDSFELRPRTRVTLPQPQDTFVVERSDKLGSLAASGIDRATLEQIPQQVRSGRRRVNRRLDSRTLRRLQVEDSRAFQAANRLLQYERRRA